MSAVATSVGGTTPTHTSKSARTIRPLDEGRSVTPRPMPSSQSSGNDTSAPSFGERRRNSAVGDPVKQYLDWIGQFPLLTRDEEAELSERALEGDKEAQDRLVNCNLRLVVRIAKDFTRGRFDLLELVSPGAEGLIIASRKYDADKGVPFGNYAAIWIKQRIMKYVAEHGFDVRVPQYRAAIVNQVVREHTRLMQAYGRPPSVQEVAEEIDHPLEDIREVLRLLQAPLELDKPMKDEGDNATFGMYFGESSRDAERRVSRDLGQIDMERAVQEALDVLPQREAQVVKWFFGLNGHRALDLDQIASRLGVSRERARQIKTGAVRKLADEECMLKYLA